MSRGLRARVHLVLPAGLDPLLGGPRGRRAAERIPARALTPVLVAALVPLAVAVLRQAHCLDSGWQGRGPLWRVCSSDLLASFAGDGLGRGLTAYLAGDLPLRQSVGSGALMAFLGGLVPPGSPLAGSRAFLILWTLLAAGCLLAGVWLVATMRGEPHRNAALAALSPVVALAVLTGPDVVGVTLASAGLWAWSRRRGMLAGLAFGLAALTSSYPLLLAFAVTVAALAADGSVARPALLRLWAALAGTLAATLIPFALARPETAVAAYRAWWSAPPGVGSPWLMPSMAGVAIPVAAGTLLAVLGWALALGLGASLARIAPGAATPAQVALVVVAVVLVTGKAVPVSASLWLVPLVALAGVRWRDALLWAAAEGAHLVAASYYLAGLEVPDKGLPAPIYTIFLVLRLVAIGNLAWQVWPRGGRGLGRMPS